MCRRWMFIRSGTRRSGYSGKKSSTGVSRPVIFFSARAMPNRIDTMLLDTERASWSFEASKVTRPGATPRISSWPVKYHSASVLPSRMTMTLWTLGSSDLAIRCRS
jgi:hypothetical protein